jgi:hypothetical protein
MSGVKYAPIVSHYISLRGFVMNLSQNGVMDSDLEIMIMAEMGVNGKILVRSLDKIHARTGVNYSTISKIADKIQKQKKL